VSELSQAAVAVKKNPTMADLIEKQKPEIERQLGGAMSSDAFVRAVLTEVRKSPKLAAADPSTVLGGVMLAAQLRLEIGSGLGEFYLTPRKEKGRDICLPIIGYQGMIKLALRSEFVVKIETFMVREGDLFEYGANAERGMFYEWKPRDFEESRPWIGVVASALMRLDLPHQGRHLWSTPSLLGQGHPVADPRGRDGAEDRDPRPVEATPEVDRPGPRARSGRAESHPRSRAR